MSEIQKNINLSASMASVSASPKSAEQDKQNQIQFSAAPMAIMSELVNALMELNMEFQTKNTQYAALLSQVQGETAKAAAKATEAQAENQAQAEVMTAISSGVTAGVTGLSGVAAPIHESLQMDKPIAEVQQKIVPVENAKSLSETTEPTKGLKFGPDGKPADVNPVRDDLLKGKYAVGDEASRKAAIASMSPEQRATFKESLERELSTLRSEETSLIGTKNAIRDRYYNPVS